MMNKVIKALKVMLGEIVETRIWNQDELKISEMVVGGKVELIVEGELSPAPDGDYELEDGSKFTVKDGVIASIVGQENSETTEVENAEEKPEQTEEAPEANNEVEELKAKVDQLQSTVDALAKTIEELQSAEVSAKSEVEAFSKEVSELHSTIKQLAKIPAEFTKTNNKQTVKESKEEKLFELAKILSKK